MARSDIAALVENLSSQAPSPSGVRLLLIDGPAGAGKTTFARELAAALDGAPVLHADDMYEGWDGLDTLTDLLVTQVLAPLAEGRPARFRRWDWHASRRGDVCETPPAPVVVIEGVGVGQREARPYASLSVWVEAPESLRHDRWLEREGVDTEPQWRAWRAAERTHFVREGTRDAVDVVVDGTRAWSPG